MSWKAAGEVTIALAAIAGLVLGIAGVRSGGYRQRSGEDRQPDGPESVGGLQTWTPKRMALVMRLPYEYV